MGITNNEIFDRTNNGWDIYKRYINKDIKPNKSFPSPLRKDKNPSFSIFLSKKYGQYIFKDHARDDIKGNAIRFVELKFMLDYQSAIQKIASDFNIQDYEMLSYTHRSSPQSTILHESDEDYSIETTNFTHQELKYFHQYGISKEQLERFNVFCVSEISIKGRKTFSSDLEPIFAYKFSWGGKIYKPKSKLRFLYYGEKPDDYIFGADQLPNSGETLIITGGEKDVLTFASLGYSSICYNSETYIPNKSQIYNFKKRFRNIIICLDTDKTGRNSASNLSKEHSLPILKLPLSGSKTDKDISDFICNGNDPNQLVSLIKECILGKYDEIIKLIKPHMFDMNKRIEKPDPILSINGQTILSNGNLMTLGGLVKTGKSSVIYSLLAASISEENSNIDTFGITVKTNNKRMAVLHFDTEQSNYDFQNRLQKAMKKSDLETKPEHFDSVHLLEFPYHMRIRIIQDMIARYYYLYNGIQLVVVDGVADLLNSVNDEDKSNQMVDMFHRMAVQYNCPIILIVHLNPDGNKTRGHLGSQLDRKSESLILIKKDGEASIITPKYCRNANVDEIPLMQFKWNKSLQSHESIGYTSSEEKDEYKTLELEDALDAIYVEGIKEMSKTDLRNALMKELKISRTLAYDYIKFSIKKEILQEEMINKRDSIISRH